MYSRRGCYPVNGYNRVVNGTFPETFNYEGDRDYLVLNTMLHCHKYLFDTTIVRSIIYHYSRCLVN